MNNLPSTGKIKAVTFFTNNGKDPCAHLRARGPMSRLEIAVIEGKEDNKTYPDRVSQGDLVLIQRDFPRDINAYEKIIELAHLENKPVILDIDDLLFYLPDNHPERLSQHYTESLLPIFQALHEADHVTVTTPILKEVLLPYNPNIIILPNYLDDAIWEMREPVANSGGDFPLVIGYMGSESHIPDVSLIVPVLRELLTRYSTEIQINFWGLKPPKEIAENPRVKWIPAQTYEYIEFARYFGRQHVDIFIAPLDDNLFNRAKSPLKFFEYTALGAPGIYSRLDPFEQVITHGSNGFLAYSPEEWLEYLELLIQNHNLRYQMALQAQATIKNKWLLSRHVSQWQEAYELMIEASYLKSDRDNPNLPIIKSLNHQYFSLIRERERDLTIKEQELALKEHELALKERFAQSLSFELAQIKSSRTYKVALILRKVREIMLPPGSLRYRVASTFFHWVQGRKIRIIHRRRKNMLDSLLGMKIEKCDCKKVSRHEESIDIIICVHNALDDVCRCLDSIKMHTQEPFSVIIVDDGSSEPTKEYLNDFAAHESYCTLISNEEAKGYTLAANIGMRHSKAPFLVLLNSDTIVGPEWLDRMYRAMTSDEKIGVVGPLSNTASWQSIPKLSENGDWALNPLPPNMSVTEMSKLVAKYSACIFPEVPLLNGFCMMIRKALIDEIGYFDEENFGQGFGEEDDFNLRAGDAGWKKVIADDVFIFHAQSKSYSNLRRHNLSMQSGDKLRKKHGVDRIAECVAIMNPNRVIEGIRSRAIIMVERENIIKMGMELFSGKKVLFILPIIEAGGGANVIIDEARCMRQMGVDARIFNLAGYKTGFLQSYPHLDIPLVFGEASELEKLAVPYDAVVASANYSVEWMKPLHQWDGGPTLGYYIQGFEPLMYPEDSEQARNALSTYTMIDQCKCFTKTFWTRNMVLDHTGVESDVVGISVNIDLFRPRDIIPLGEKPVTIVAMIRPSSPYRNPEMTLNILGQVSRKFGKDVDVWLFGANDVREIVDKKFLDFNWRQLGKLTQVQVASMMSKADIFTDFSSHQAMGLSALEAMSAGCSVIVPQKGGAVEFVHHKENGLVVDTSNFQECSRLLEELVEDNSLRKQLQLAGIRDIVQYYPEKVSYNILNTLFRKT